MNLFLMFGKKFEMKAMKDYHDLYLKCDVLTFYYQPMCLNNLEIID